MHSPLLRHIARRICFAIVLIQALAVIVLPAAAQSGDGVVTDDEVNAIAKELYCPVCESTPLDVCATQACADWREVIRTKLSEGQSPEEIKEYFALQYGTRALAEPPRQGFTLAVWVGPIIVVLLSAVLFGRYLRRIRVANEDQVVASADTLTVETEPRDDYTARIERELRERRS
jgi:cytochrome c-type biogenesis protein CcmH